MESTQILISSIAIIVLTIFSYGIGAVIADIRNMNLGENKISNIISKIIIGGIAIAIIVFIFKFSGCNPSENALEENFNL